MSNDNHIAEKELLTARYSNKQVKDISPQCDDERNPLGPLEAMRFAQEYIKTLNNNSE